MALSATGDVVQQRRQPRGHREERTYVIVGDVEIEGTLNTTGITNTDTLAVVDDFTEIAMDSLRERLVPGSVNGCASTPFQTP
jgi:hypothetical protein